MRTSFIPVDFGDSRTIDLYWTHRAEGTEHFHSLKTTRWPVARKNNPVFRPERTRLVTCLSISESLRRWISLSTCSPVSSSKNDRYVETRDYNFAQMIRVLQSSMNFSQIVSLFDYIY